MATRNALIVGCLLTAIAAAAPAARAAMPRAGSWASPGTSEPKVTFAVRGPAARRTVELVAVPLWCGADPEPDAWSWIYAVRPVHSRGRFSLRGDGFALHGRFVARDRAEVAVRTDVNDDCTGVRRYVVNRTDPRVRVREGIYRALVSGGAATVQFEVSAFGRMVEVLVLAGSVPATCSDGTRRTLPLGSPDRLVLAAPIRPGGRFDISVAGSPSISISGDFDHGAVGGSLTLSAGLADGTSCRARVLTVVGALDFPMPTVGGIAADFPGPPAVLADPL